MIWRILVILAVVVIYYIFRNYLWNDGDAYDSNIELEQKNNEENVTYMEETTSTKQLALRIIENIGSKPQFTEEGRIYFEYQGIDFLMEATDDCKFVNLIWPWCHSFSKFDIDEFARVRQVVNEVNMNDSLSVFYTFTDSDEVALHIKKHFLLVPQVPEVEEYLRVILNGFFRTARTLNLEIEKCRMNECKAQV
ncbi:hypothetical protein [Prevotella sp. E2-28]|uniref:hypothetical protein n=1 Tax=Prevotella sp. E2-28 TaxID=2913620 RepID=UPI001EDB135A|nr:hypothetical protein [Prevotella sp. E2-28]UKK53048.1 hypothetical protein L6465_10705 [Prevotella sp. E2-28]